MTYRRTVERLGELEPPQEFAADFEAGMADQRALVRLMGRMIKRPDYIYMATSRPPCAGAELGSGLEGRLAADARAKFGRIDALSCMDSMPG